MLSQYKYFVLAPDVHTGDPNVDYYYDFTQSIQEYTEVFAELDLQWQWTPVSITNVEATLISIIQNCNELKPLIINLCDGDDTNNVPGVSVIHLLEKLNLPYTGADAFFYNITTSKIPMKQAFDNANVSTAPWLVINDDLVNPFSTITVPIIIKPAVSGGSMGISINNVVHNQQEFTAQVAILQQGYNGWNLMVDGLFAEEFIIGQEYTTFIIGHYTKPDECKIYEPIHRVFHHSLPAIEQFLSFDRLWEIYEQESAMPNQDNFYEYLAVENKTLVEQLKQETLKAFVSCKGIGYARIDFRVAETDGKIYCLEVNAQCGLSKDEDYTSIGAILRVSNESFTNVIKAIIEQVILYD